MISDYFLNPSGDELTAPFSQQVLLPVKWCLFISAGLMICSLPMYSFFKYAVMDKPPVIFPVLFIFSLIYLSYFHLVCGRGEFFDKAERSKQKSLDKPFMEETSGFFSYTLPGFVLHIGFVQMMLLPFHILAAAVSGISLNLLLISLIILFLSSLITRCIGFLSFLWFGPRDNPGFLLSRFLFLIFICLSGLQYPLVNPVYIIYRIHREQVYDGFDITITGIHFLTNTGIFLVLTMGCLITLKIKLRRQKKCL